MTETLAGLNPEQAEAVQTTNGPMLIMAGAGSGKTKVLTCRIAHLLQQGVRPYRILAITFTNKAAAEMRERVDKMAGAAAKDVWLFTFHAFCARFLRMEITKLGGYGSNFAIYDSSDSQNLIKQILKELNLDEKRFQPAGIASRISNAKTSCRASVISVKLLRIFTIRKLRRSMNVIRINCWSITRWILTICWYCRYGCCRKAKKCAPSIRSVLIICW